MAGARAIFIGVVVGASLLISSGCRSAPDEEPIPSIRQLSETMIRTTVADQAGLGDLSPVCPEVTEVSVGVTWECSAATADERLINLDGWVNERGQVELVTTNVITGSALPSFELAAVDALNAQVPGANLVEESIDCGETSVVFGQDRVLVCALADPRTQQVFDVSLTIEDIEARQFSLKVAETPRA